MPKKLSFYRNISTAKIEFAEHFSQYKWWYVLLAVFSVLGLIIGLITGFSIAPDATISKIPDSIFLNFIEGNSSIFGVFFARLFSIIAMFGLIFIFNFKPFLCFLNFIFLIYRGFVLGATISLLIILFNIGGVLNVIFIVIPCHLVMLIALISWSSVCMSFCFSTKMFGGCIISKEFFCNNKSVIFVLAIICFIAVFIEALLLPWLTSTIVIGT